MKKFLTIVMITLAAFAAKADFYLYWTVPAEAWDGAGYAAIMGNTGSGYTQLGNKVALGAEADTLIGSSTSYVDYIVSLFTYADGAWNTVANSSKAYTFSDLVATGSTYENLGSMSQLVDSPASFSDFTATIPEPTSGLMLLLGLGALALKRKVA